MSDMLRLRIGCSEREVFCVIYLDSQHRLIEVEELFYGTLDGAAVYPREVAKFIVSPNHAYSFAEHGLM